ncbi:hypothetical protein RSOL_489320 [Rhizoctonia solani AG-3 Rhs1AP]|uniref:Uncharacterized protein n=2 Tax=Rhizoctonia solani AG-3 TaxID=1086053 RepID=A0A074ST59_9AGAM|nr:hypothetical protein RSOL_489320 [Rhizoctonia solani AG-3 Rhs1AP]KEP53122.1 hypothetical protein V565_035440 [Rhizoctonia solani 123E]
MSWLLSASSFNPSLAWVMNNGGKGFIIVKFPFTLDSGWYHEQDCTRFRSFQHRKERKGLKHEFIALNLIDGSVCRIERMGDPNARLNALDPLGSVAHDIAQCFRPEDLDQAHLDSSELITEVKLPCEFDLLDVLKICRAIHDGEKTSKYTLQVYNCYFFSLAIQACLTRLVAGWEDEQPLRLWLSQVENAVEALTNIDQASMSPSSPFDHQKLFKLCFLLASHHEYNEESLLYELRSRLQSRITTSPKDIQRDLTYRLNDVLWHSAVHSTLSEFIDEEVTDTILDELQERVSEATLGYSRTGNDPLGELKAQSLSIVTELVVLAAGTRREAASASFSTAPNKCLKQKLVNQLSTSSSSSPLLTELSLWGITVFSPYANPIPCVFIDQQLDYELKRLEKLGAIAQEDLEHFTQEARALTGDITAVWNQRPWEIVCYLIKQHVSANMSQGFSLEIPELGLQVYSEGKQRSETISGFQDHILDRIKVHAKVVERFGLGSAASIQIELEDTLSFVWETIREDSSIGSIQKIEQTQETSIINENPMESQDNSNPSISGIQKVEQAQETSITNETLTKSHDNSTPNIIGIQKVAQDTSIANEPLIESYDNSYSRPPISSTPISSGRGRYASKKYVDLIFKASGKYGNWDPPRTVEVGDWGKLDTETGHFVKEGNIFRDPECSALLSDAPDAPLIRKGSTEDVLRITSGAQMELKNDSFTEVGGMGELGVRVSSTWEFTPRNRAAVLTATDAYSNYLEVGVAFPRLRKVRKLEGKAIVTEALHCPAYALLLTEKGKGGKASLTLHTGLSNIPASAGVGAKGGWNYTTETGVWRTAYGYRATLDGEDAVYTPLYGLEKVPRWRVGYR